MWMASTEYLPNVTNSPCSEPPRTSAPGQLLHFGAADSANSSFALDLDNGRFQTERVAAGNHIDPTVSTLQGGGCSIAHRVQQPGDEVFESVGVPATHNVDENVAAVGVHSLAVRFVFCQVDGHFFDNGLNRNCLTGFEGRHELGRIATGPPNGSPQSCR